MSNVNSNWELSPWDIIKRHDTSGFHLGGGGVVTSCQNFAPPWKLSCYFLSICQFDDMFSISLNQECISTSTQCGPLIDCMKMHQKWSQRFQNSPGGACP